jgi:hypothetical protein
LAFFLCPYHLIFFYKTMQTYFDRKLDAHQKRGRSFLEKVCSRAFYPGGLLLHQQGTGKTLTTLSYILRNFGLKSFCPSIIVSKTASKNAWMDDIKRINDDYGSDISFYDIHSSRKVVPGHHIYFITPSLLSKWYKEAKDSASIFGTMYPSVNQVRLGIMFIPLRMTLTP